MSSTPFVQLGPFRNVAAKVIVLNNFARLFIECSNLWVDIHIVTCITFKRLSYNRASEGVKQQCCLLDKRFKRCVLQNNRHLKIICSTQNLIAVMAAWQLLSCLVYSIILAAANS